MSSGTASADGRAQAVGGDGEGSVVAAEVVARARAADAARGTLATASDATLNRALTAMAEHLGAARDTVLAANREDLAAAEAQGMAAALVDRLRLDEARLEGMAGQLHTLAATPFPEPSRVVGELPNGLIVSEARCPVGVIGANFEARPNVVVDIASQFIKSRNAGVLRTGSAALRSAIALIDHVVAPALREAGLDGDAVQLVRLPDREAAYELVRHPGLLPLVVLRGSGDTTRALSREAAMHGVSALAHADGGGVLYIDRAADEATVERIVEQSLDRLGVCNRLNLLLIDEPVYDSMLGTVRGVLDRLGVALSLPPHAHARGHEWALDDGHEATVTVDRVSGPAEAARIANEETSGLAASILTEDQAAARAFLDSYRGTAALWNATTRLIDGFKLLAVPETGINVDHAPGPRGPVTFRDLCLRQFVVAPADAEAPRPM